MTDDAQVAVVIRIPSALHEHLKRRAAEDERSMAATIRHALRLYLSGGSPDDR